jgi:hypothetical protein
VRRFGTLLIVSRQIRTAVNAEQLKKRVGGLYRLRPMAARLGADREELEPIDDQWRLDSVETNPARVVVRNIRTGHFVELQSDNVREYRSPDFLVLRCQLALWGRSVEIEPILNNARDAFDRIERLMPELLAEMKADLAAHPLRREIVLLGKTWGTGERGLNSCTTSRSTRT